MDLKAIYRKYKPILQPMMYLHNRLLALRVRGGRGNQVTGLKNCRMKHCRFAFHGTGNVVEIGDLSTLYGVTVNIYGNDNRITLGQRVSLDGCCFSVEDDGNRIEIGDHTYIFGGTELAAIEGTAICVGEDCLMSSNIMIRTGDSHSILNAEGKRINPSGDIHIGSHVWLGREAKVLKNACIAPNCVVGMGSLITHSTPVQEASILAGTPARITKSGINWSMERIPIEE